jgi:hypothetical protein
MLCGPTWTRFEIHWISLFFTEPLIWLRSGLKYDLMKCNEF